MNSAPNPSAEAAAPQKTLRLRLSSAAESVVRGGHPWVFAESLREQNRSGASGELAVVFDRKDRFLAIGLFDPDSPIRVRILHQGKPAVLDEAWWRGRLEAALARRAGLFDEQTNGHRWVSGESDGWPGLVLDRFGATLVLKLYTAAWFGRLPQLVAWIGAALSPERLVLRLSRNIQEQAAAAGLAEGQILIGPPLEGAVIFQENGIRFEAEVARGQKTGFFLDQRDNRSRVGGLARGRDVLNAFSFSGGFSLYAARGGARSVTDLDISPHALEGAKRNFALNAADPGVAACRHETVQTDAFRWLENLRERRFDLVVLDPPSLARREAERAGAVAAYQKLAVCGLAALRPGGVLVSASCSAHVSAPEFFEAVRRAAQAVCPGFKELAATAHPPDHPAGFAEANYLKCLYLQV